MIVTSLKGGLGNQMFQYAAGKRLADHLGTKLFIDLSWFSNANQVDAPRDYELDCFKFKALFIKSDSFSLASHSPTVKTKLYRYTKGLLKPVLAPYIEKSHAFDREVLRLPNNTFLDGFWQNENYFKDIRKQLLKDFSFKTPPSAKNKTFLQEINTVGSVSIHVRRGDYAAVKATQNFHGLMGLDYYKAAVDKISGWVKQPHFFVFSDEPEWCKKNLKFNHPATYVGSNPGYEDLRLMLNCQHNITANSSFSWWGAWLNQNPKKIVIAPKLWFKDSSMANADIVPKDWLKI